MAEAIGFNETAIGENLAIITARSSSGAETESAREFHNFRLPLSDVPIYCRRCAQCGFMFADAFDGWSSDRFKTHICNSDYLAVDPDYAEKRPRTSGEMVAALWSQRKAQMRVLNHGGSFICGKSGEVPCESNSSGELVGIQ